MKAKMKALTLALCAVLLVATTVFVTVAYLTSTTGVVENTFTVGDVVIKLDETDTDDTTENSTTNFSDTDITYTYDSDTVQRDLQNKYKLLPGLTYVKDPTVHIEAGSEPSYIRMIVTITDITEVKKAFANVSGAITTDNKFLPQALVSGWDSTKWVSTNIITEDSDKDTATYEFRYYKIVDTLNNTLTTGSFSENYTVYTEDKTTGNLNSNTSCSANNTTYYDLEPLFTNVVIPGSLNNDALRELENANVEIKIVAHAIQAAGFGTADEAWKAFNAQQNTTTTQE